MMLDASEPVIELLDLEFRTEDPVLQFERYGIAIHFALERVRKPGIALRRRRRKPSLPPASVHLDSWEQDMLAYAYRAPPPPLRTTLLAPPKGQRSVDMILPPALSYRSEGRQVVLSAPPAPPGSPAERRRRLEVRVAQTTFARSGMAVLHVILVPGTPLDEYDLIKLSKVWEGGEGLPRPGEPQVWLKFRPGNATGTRRNNDAEGLVFKELAAQMAGGREFRSPQGSHATFRVGTIQLLPDELVSAPSASWWRELIDDMKSVKESPSKFASEHPAGSPRHRRVLALGGIMQGLLDFPAVDATELSDVFAEFGEYGELPLGFHKGTLLHVAPSDRPWKATQDYLGVSPYLLVTHGILLHNEERLKHADRLSVAISRGARRWSRPWATRAGRLRSVRADMVTALDEMVPNVMHYGQERWIYDKGRTSRGLQELEDQVEAELRHAAVTIDARVNYDLALASGLVGIIATAIAFLPVPKWLIPVLVAAVAIGYVVFVKVRARPSSASDPRVGRHS
jgi:hypothetical protein